MEEYISDDGLEERAKQFLLIKKSHACVAMIVLCVIWFCFGWTSHERFESRKKSAPENSGQSQ